MFLLFIVLICSIIKTQITRIVSIKSNTVIFTFTCLNFVSSDRPHIPWEKSLVFLFNPRPTFSVPVQFNSVAQSCPTLCAPWFITRQAFLSIINSRSSFKLMSIKSLMPTRWTWVCPAISSSVIPFSSCAQSLPASGSFPVGQLFAWGGQSIGVSASASVLPMNTQGWSPTGWTGWISLQSKGLSRVFSNTTVQKHQFFGTQLSSQSNSHIHTWPLEKS